MEFVSKAIANQNEEIARKANATNTQTTNAVTVDQHITDSQRPVICHMNVSNSSESGFSEDNTFTEEIKSNMEDNPTNLEESPPNTVVINASNTKECPTADLTRHNSSASDISYIKVETIETTEVIISEYYTPKTAPSKTQLRNSRVNQESAIYSHNGKIVNGHLRYCINSSKVTDV